MSPKHFSPLPRDDNKLLVKLDSLVLATTTRPTAQDTKAICGRSRCQSMEHAAVRACADGNAASSLDEL